MLKTSGSWEVQACGLEQTGTEASSADPTHEGAQASKYLRLRGYFLGTTRHGKVEVDTEHALLQRLVIN